MFIIIDTGFSEDGSYTDKGIRQNMYVRLNNIESFQMNSTGKKLIIYTTCSGRVLTQFNSPEEFIQYFELNVLKGSK